ncbi:hypothetical protein OG592_35435 [Streptomyces avidinii]|uniref:hypothetical protein n=1 Tax=Streptomyces avidinii TaxID=1895 RepID=UPI0038691307|nr:hypothetical protein OG592_35435 [Streptomyces avidinii]
MGHWACRTAYREDDIIIVRRRHARAALAFLALTALTAATATACAFPLQDLGPLPPRYSGPPLPADTVVSEMTSVLAAEGITVEREPSGVLGRCWERLSGRHAPETVEAALKAAVARARSEHGWQTGPDTDWERLTLTKGNWTVMAGFAAEVPPGGQAPVIVSLTCVDGGDTTTAPTAPSALSLAPAPAPAST